GDDGEEVIVHGWLSQLPFGWVCFSNSQLRLILANCGFSLNCLSAGSVSLTGERGGDGLSVCDQSQLPLGWVCFFNGIESPLRGQRVAKSQLPFGWVCFSNVAKQRRGPTGIVVSIAFRLGLFL